MTFANKVSHQLNKAIKIGKNSTKYFVEIEDYFASENTPKYKGFDTLSIMSSDSQADFDSCGNPYDEADLPDDIYDDLDGESDLIEEVFFSVQDYEDRKNEIVNELWNDSAAYANSDENGWYYDDDDDGGWENTLVDPSSI